jgi:hypothetical protein
MAHPHDHEQRIRRARLSLDGLSVGDAFGERFFLAPETVERMVSGRELPVSPWRYSDDTVMGLSVFETLRQHGEIIQDRLARRFADKYSRDPLIQFYRCSSPTTPRFSPMLRSSRSRIWRSSSRSVVIPRSAGTCSLGSPTRPRLSRRSGRLGTLHERRRGASHDPISSPLRAGWEP